MKQSSPSLFPMNLRRKPLRYETEEFCGDDLKECLDNALAWLDDASGGLRAAKVCPSGEDAYVIMPIALYERFDDIVNQESYLPHWELDGIAAEDLPTVRDVLVAANDGLLRECVREVLEEAIYPGESPKLDKACDYIRGMTDILRDFEYDPCNSIVLLPYCRYRAGGEGTVREMQVITLRFDDARNGRIVRACDDRLDWWSLTLGLKAWLGDVSIRDQHRALAWLLCTMHADGLVSYGVWMGGRPSREYTDQSVRELNEQADNDLRQRAKNAMDRLRDPKDLVDFSIECEQEDYDMFVEACAQRGLSVQNGFHIALRRLIAWYRERS